MFCRDKDPRDGVSRFQRCRRQIFLKDSFEEMPLRISWMFSVERLAAGFGDRYIASIGRDQCVTQPPSGVQIP